MKKYLLTLAAVLLTATASLAQNPLQIQNDTIWNGRNIGFYEYKPASYNSNESKTYPLIIFLHGWDEMGNGTSELWKVENAGIPNLIKKGATMTFNNPQGVAETFLVLSPQLDKAFGFWNPLYVDAMLHYAKNNLKVDVSRIYLTGLSLGGGGTWRYAWTSFENARQFAAIAPISPTMENNNYQNLCNSIAAAKTAVWAFHNEGDPETQTKSSNTHWFCNNLKICENYDPANLLRETYYDATNHNAWDKAYDVTSNLPYGNLYEWFLRFSRSGVVNVNAGADQTITTADAKVQVTGSATSPSGVTIKNYSWIMVSGPNQPNIVSATTAATEINNLVAGIYVFRLTVTGSDNSSATDDVKVTVNATSASPIAKAGNDHSVPYGYSTPLIGSASSDEGGYITKFQWEKYSGPSSYNLVSPLDDTCWLNTLTVGDYVFKLTVTDNDNNTAWDTVSVKVFQTNKPPVANAGPDVIVPLGYSTVLNGRGSKDPDGSITSFVWSKYSGPSSYNLVSPNLDTTWLNSLVEGVYLFKLTVKDNSGLTAWDTVRVTVTPPPSGSMVGNELTSHENLHLKLSVKTYPNPVINNLNYSIEGKTNGPAEIHIIDMKGRIIKRSTITKDQAKLSGTIAVNDLATGVYTIQFTFKNVKERVTMSFVK